MQELYAPGSGQAPTQQGQIPKGIPIVEGQVVQQIVGRGQPAIMIVPPKAVGGPPAPQIAIVPPQQGGRTTIGTFVEQPIISPTKSNPLAVGAGGQVAIDQKLPEPELTEEVQPLKPKPKRPPLDLAKEILTHIWELGESAEKFYDRSPDTFKRWQQNPGIIPLQAVQKFIARKPAIKEIILEELEPHFAADNNGATESLPNRGKTNVMICSPILERPTLPYLWVIAYLCKKYELGLSIQADTMINRSRNMLADRFLKSGALWSLWIDGDMAAPIANGDWYKWITGATAVPDEYCTYDVLARLLGHSKPVVGGVYASRKFKGQLVMQPEIKARGHEDRLLCNEIRRGSARGLAAVDWIGFGVALVHREVFLEVQRRFPQLAPHEEFAPWRYFQPDGDEGEDEAFCQRVRACSIPIWLDTQLVCGHIGPACFLPEHTQPLMAI